MAENWNGLLVLDKTAGITSRGAIDQLVPFLPRGTRIGHTGTLDPLATGVLVVCLGVATRVAEYVQRMSKEYHSTFRLGATSDTDDADGRITTKTDAPVVSEPALRQALGSFIGRQLQTPPAYSAIKFGGRRSYQMARQGVAVAPTPKEIEIYEIELLNYAWPLLELQIRCGKGTYVRSLARDLGEYLGCGALVQTLRRTRVGGFTAAMALPKELTVNDIQSGLLPLEAALADLPRLTVSREEAIRLCQGRWIALGGEAKLDTSYMVSMVECAQLVAIATLIQGRLHAEKVLVDGNLQKLLTIPS